MRGPFQSRHKLAAIGTSRPTFNEIAAYIAFILLDALLFAITLVSWWQVGLVTFSLFLVSAWLTIRHWRKHIAQSAKPS